MPHRTIRACQMCGRPFYGNTDCHYCPECVKFRKSNAVVRIRTCQDCGIGFQGGPRARRCPDCAYKAQQQTSRMHKKNGAKRPLGSIDACVVCGQEYIVSSGRQKYCSPECQRKGVLAWQKEHKKDYEKNLGKMSKRQNAGNAAKKYACTAYRNFQVAPQQILVLITAAQNRGNYCYALQISIEEIKEI